MAKEKLFLIKKASEPTNVKGTVWFDTTNKVIKVGNGGTSWDAFDCGGKVKDASFVNGVLTISKYEGDPVVLNLSTLADAKAVAKAFEEVETLISTNAGKIKTNEEAIKSIQDELDSLSGGAGSIATQIKNAIDTLDVEDTVVEGQYVSGVSETDGKITVTRAALPDYTETYDAKGAAAAAETAAKAYADGLASNYDAAGAAATAKSEAIADAKTYADGLASNYDAAGTGEAKAEAALAAAKSYADGLAVNYDAAGTAAGLNEAMDERVKVLEAIDHAQLAADASAAAVATVLDGAPEKFDTLKEVAQWISDSESAATAADLVTRVAGLEAIDHDAYKGADETVLASAKSYADGLAVNYEVAGAAKTAEDNAKAYADGLAGNYDAKGDAAQALVDAKAYADGLAGNYDANGSAAAAESAAKTYADGLNTAMDARVDALEAIDHNAYVAADAQVLSDAKAYADSVFMWEEFE